MTNETHANITSQLIKRVEVLEKALVELIGCVNHCEPINGTQEFLSEGLEKACELMEDCINDFSDVPEDQKVDELS